MIPLSLPKKSGLILLGVLVATGVSTYFFQPQPVHGTPDCSAQIAAVLAGTGGLLSFFNSGATLTAAIDSDDEAIQSHISSAYSLTNALSTATGSLNAASSGAIAIINSHLADVLTLSGSLSALQSSFEALIASRDASAYVAAIDAYEACMSE